MKSGAYAPIDTKTYLKLSPELCRTSPDRTRYVSPKFVKAFSSANAGQIQTAREKKIKQRVYPSSEILIDAKTLSARIQMDRIFSIKGISATRPITLDMTFEYGSRTSQNPEGIYITDEKLVPEKQ